MNKFLIFVFILLPFLINGQPNDSLITKNYSSNQGNFSLTVGEIFLNKNDYWLESNSLLPINTIGVDFEEVFILSRGPFYYDSRLSFHLFIPNDFVIANNSISISGYKASILPVGIDIFSKNKNIDFIASVGISFGRFKQENKYDNGVSSKFKNNFTLLELSIEPRYVTKFLTFSLRPFYGYDLSSGSWKGDNTMNDKPQITKLSIYGAYASIGWTLH